VGHEVKPFIPTILLTLLGAKKYSPLKKGVKGIVKYFYDEKT